MKKNLVIYIIFILSPLYMLVCIICFLNSAVEKMKRGKKLSGIKIILNLGNLHKLSY